MRLAGFVGACIGAAVVCAIEEYLDVWDWLTDKDAKFQIFQVEQRARLWSDGT